MTIHPVPKNSIFEILNLKKQMVKAKEKKAKEEILLKCIKLILPLSLINPEFKSHFEIIDNIEEYMKGNKIRNLNEINFHSEIIDLNSYYNNLNLPIHYIFSSINMLKNLITNNYYESHRYYRKQIIKNCIKANELYFKVKLKKAIFGKYKLINNES